MKTQERRLGVAEIDGWHIESITTTRFEATKDGETVRLDSDTIAGIVELIKTKEDKHGEP